MTPLISDKFPLMPIPQPRNTDPSKERVEKSSQDNPRDHQKEQHRHPDDDARNQSHIDEYA